MGAIFATICALSFFSVGLSYKSIADLDNYTYEHNMIGKYITEWATLYVF